MDPLFEKLRRVLEAEFPPPAVINLVEGSWGDDEPNFMVFVITDDFEDVDGFERQKMVWKPLKANLAPEERDRIAIVIATTKATAEFADAHGPSWDD